MKKIKYLLGIGILGTLFSTCFGSNTSGSLSVFHSVDSVNGNSNAYFGTWDQDGGFKKNIPYYNSITGGEVDFRGNSYGIQIGNVWSTSRNQSLPSFRFNFYSPYGFVITGNNYLGVFSVVDLIDSSYTFFGGLNQNYYNGDFYPFIFNSDTQEYLTFNNENTLAFNGHTYNFGTGYGLLKYCFYGIDYDLSCLFYNGSSYKYVNFSLNNDSISIYTGFFIIPLHISNTSNNIGSFTGNSTLILSPIYNNSLGVYEIAYNIIDLYSFDVFDLKNSNIIDKGIINIDIDSFLNRTFLSMPSVRNTNTIKNGLGYFSEIFELNGNYFYRSNSVISYGNNTSPDNIGNCLYHMHSCIPYGSLELLSDSNVPDILNSISGGGNNGSSSFPDPIFDGGVFDANTYLIEESIKCYLTSGEVCNPPFTYENSTNYVNNYDHQERVRNSTDKTGYLTFNNSVDMLSQYCLNVNTIQYAFCSQLYLYEGSPITYYYNNGYFNYIISGSGWEVNLGTLWSGQLGYAYCDGPYCSNFNEGLPQFIRQDTGDYSAYGFSGEYVSLDFFKNYFENGFFFQCPFSYSGSYFTIGSKLIDRLDKHDPLKPINCMIAGFSYGIKSSFFGDSKLGLSHTGVFLQNTGPNATRFYTFIDILLSLGYIFLFSKLFKFLKKH